MGRRENDWGVEANLDRRLTPRAWDAADRRLSKLYPWRSNQIWRCLRVAPASLRQTSTKNIKATENQQETSLSFDFYHAIPPLNHLQCIVRIIKWAHNTFLMTKTKIGWMKHAPRKKIPTSDGHKRTGINWNEAKLSSLGSFVFCPV